MAVAAAAGTDRFRDGKIAANGRCFVWYTTELEELTKCERICVFREGTAVMRLAGQEIEPTRILEASFRWGNV